MEPNRNLLLLDNTGITMAKRSAWMIAVVPGECSATGIMALASFIGNTETSAAEMATVREDTSVSMASAAGPSRKERKVQDVVWILNVAPTCVVPGTTVNSSVNNVLSWDRNATCLLEVLTIV